MELYEVSTDENTWDEYDSFAVFAESAEEAVKIVVDSFIPAEPTTYSYLARQAEQKWVAELIPTAKGIVHSSFNAG